MYPAIFICAQITPSTWRIYLRADKFIWARINIFLCRRGTLLCQRGALLVRGSCPISASATSPPGLSLLQPGKMSSPPSEDPLASFDFLPEFLPPAIDFGEGFRFDEPFNFGDSMNAAAGSLLSYGAYDDDSCSFSVESSVQLRRRHRR